MTKLPLALRQAAYTRSFWDEEVERARPKTRGDCGSMRPCPFISCRHHLAISVDEETGSIKETFPHLRILADPEGEGLDELERLHGTCTLDIAEKHDDGTGGLGGLVALHQIAESGRPLGQTPGMTIEEVGNATNLSVERIRQVASEGTQSLRIKLRRLG